MENNEIKLDKKNVSYIVAALLLSFFFIFLAGFYAGKKNAINSQVDLSDLSRDTDDLSVNLGQDHGSREIDEANMGGDELVDDRGELFDNIANAKLENISENIQANKSQVISENENEKLEVKTSERENLKKKEQEKPSVKDNKFYYAAISGFGNLNAANKVKKDKFGQFDVIVIKKQAKSNKGILKPWYQIITIPTGNKEKLKAELGQIKKVAKIKDIKILEIAEKEKQNLFQKEV